MSTVYIYPNCIDPTLPSIYQYSTTCLPLLIDACMRKQGVKYGTQFDFQRWILPLMSLSLNQDDTAPYRRSSEVVITHQTVVACTCTD